MTPINTVHPQQTITQLNRVTNLRQAAASPDIPKLTQDESNLIQETFMPAKDMNLYTNDGRINVQPQARGLNIDTRI